MRQKELNGVNVMIKDDNNNYVTIGNSRNAGYEVLKNMVISRGSLSFLGIGIPVLLIIGMSKFPFYHKNK